VIVMYAALQFVRESAGLETTRVEQERLISPSLSVEWRIRLGKISCLVNSIDVQLWDGAFGSQRCLVWSTAST
jgi:hypothetical protein